MRPLIGTSWKMNLTSTEADRWLTTFSARVAGVEACQLFVLPPYTSIWLARERLTGTGIAWGAQDVHPAESGAHTGDVSAAMLADLGCTFVEVGHSERRRDHGETAALVASKVAAVLRWGMRPIVCVGEPARIPAREVVRLLRADLEVILGGVELTTGIDRVVVAYEPHWAIGVGARAASAEHVGSISTALGNWLAERAGGIRPPIIYGGSVDLETAPAILAAPGVDGLFVGRYALDAERFARLAWSAADRARDASGIEARGRT